MKSVKYTSEGNFRCLEDLQGTSSEITLIHVGQEVCEPYHIFSGIREEYIIHFITAGRGFYSSNGNAWSLSAGQMFLIYPGDTVVYCSDSKEPWTYSWIGFKGFRSESILKQCGFSRHCLTLSSPEPTSFLSLFDEMFRHVELTFYDDLYRESVLLQIFSVLSRHYSEVSAGSKMNQSSYVNNIHVNQAIEYINSSYMNGINVSDIASHIGISRAHLNHVFQEELNVSVQYFLIDYRMYRAASLLKHTSDSVKEIAYKVGYNDPLVFSKVFKRKFGVSPKKFRMDDHMNKNILEIRDKRP